MVVKENQHDTRNIDNIIRYGVLDRNENLYFVRFTVANKNYKKLIKKWNVT